MERKTAHIRELDITNNVHLCDSCQKKFPACDGDNVIWGDGAGYNNICSCGGYVPFKIKE